jgi:GTP-binding protein EngB required for normal cell division
VVFLGDEAASCLTLPAKIIFTGPYFTLQRSHRSELFHVGLIGWTNVGKTALLNAVLGFQQRDFGVASRAVSVIFSQHV